MITTTLHRIRDHNPCERGWKKLLTHLGKTQADDEPLPYTTIMDSNGNVVVYKASVKMTNAQAITAVFIAWVAIGIIAVCQ